MNPYLMQNPFLNPIYGNYGQPVIPQQNVQQPIQTIGISGKYVNDFNEINASDIPMSSPAIFAKNDRSEIQIREWNANGQIDTTRYKPYIEPVQQVVKQEPIFDYKAELLEPIFDKLAELEQQVSKINVQARPVAKKAVSE